MLHTCQHSRERSQQHHGDGARQLGVRSLPLHAPAAAAAAQHVLAAAAAAPGAPGASSTLPAHHAGGGESLFSGASRMTAAMQRQAAKIATVFESVLHAPPGSPLAAVRRRITTYTLLCPQRQCLLEGQPLATPGLIIRVMPVRAGMARASSSPATASATRVSRTARA